MNARDELAALIYATVAVDRDDDTMVVGFGRHGESRWGDARGECRRIADAILAAGWVQLRQCDHQWMTTFGASHPDAGPPWRECSSCGRTEDLTA